MAEVPSRRAAIADRSRLATQFSFKGEPIRAVSGVSVTPIAAGEYHIPGDYASLNAAALALALV